MVPRGVPLSAPVLLHVCLPVGPGRASSDGKQAADRGCDRGPISCCRQHCKPPNSGLMIVTHPWCRTDFRTSGYQCLFCSTNEQGPEKKLNLKGLKTVPDINPSSSPHPTQLLVVAVHLSTCAPKPCKAPVHIVAWDHLDARHVPL